MIGPNMRRLMWFFLIANVTGAVLNGIAGQVTWGIICGCSASLTAVVLAVNADIRAGKP